MLSKDEITARSLRLAGRAPNPYTGTLNDPFEEAQSRYSGPGWDQFFGGLQKTEEDAQLAGKNYRVNWGGFGNAVDDGGGMARGRGLSLGAMRSGDLNPLEETAQKNFILSQQANAAIEQARAERDALNERNDAVAERTNARLGKSYDDFVLSSAFVPASPIAGAPPKVPVGPVLPGSGDNAPSYTARPTASPTADQEKIRSVPGAMRPAIDAELAKNELTRAQAAVIPEKQKLDEFSAGLGTPPMAIDASRPDPKTGNVIDARTGRTPNAIHQDALGFALEGKTPALGNGSKAQTLNTRSAIENKAGAIAAAAGVDLPTVRAEYKANSGALSKLMPQAQATANAANTASDNLDLALGESPKVSRTDSKWVNSIANAFVKGATSAGNLTKFETYIYTAAREYAKVTSGGAASSQGLTDSAAKEAEKLLNSAQSPEAFRTAVEAMKDDMANVTARQAQGLSKVSNTIGQFFAAANGVPLNATQPTSATVPPSSDGRGGGPALHKVGDIVIGPDGKQRKVLEVSPDGKRYRVEGGG